MKSNLTVLDETASTQDVVRDLAQRGEPGWTAVMALKQTRGRGRAGRSWISPAGKNVALSLLLRPAVPATEVPLLGLLASVAVAEAAELLGLTDVQLRWPNDVMVEGRKLAGILSEAAVNNRGELDYVVIGVGVNVNSTPEDFDEPLRGPVTSFLTASGRERSVVAVAEAFLEKIEALMERVDKEGPIFIADLWKIRWPYRGRIMRVAGRDAVAEDVDKDGAVLLRFPDGRVMRVIAEDVDPVEAFNET